MQQEVDPGMKEYLKTLKGHEYDPISRDEERRLMKRYKKSHDMKARDTLLKSNMRYACSLVTPYVGMGLSYRELLSEANDGLIESIDKFDIKFDNKLFSYSKWWIKQRMQAALDKKNKPKVKFDELPSEDNSKSEDSLENEAYNNGETSYKQDGYEYEHDTEYEIEDRTKFIKLLMEALTPREAQIVNMYFGVGYDEQYTLSEIGKKIGLTKERVRQIFEASLKKIRSKAILLDDDFFGDI